MATLLINILDHTILNEAPKDTVVVSYFDKQNKKNFKNKFNFFPSFDIFHDPLKEIKKNFKLIYPSREELKFVNNNFINFSFQLNRWTNIRKYNYKSDQKILFEYLVFWLTLIHHKSINKCFIDEDPHRAFDYIGYLILKFKKIPCYILANMNYGGYRTFIKETIESNLISSLKISEISKKLICDIENSQVDLNHIPGKKIINKKNKNLKLIFFKEIRKFLKKINALFELNTFIRPKPFFSINYPITKIIFNYTSIINKLFYRIFYKLFSVPFFKVNSGDIVFYSHYFPERTSIPLADPFGYNILDCILFLNESGKRVLYKEHPVSLNLMNSHRNSCHHDFSFMKNLLKMKTILVKNISNNEHVVATLNGTAGLEFAIKGYKVICFGNPWYSFLPNVYIYKNINSMKEFINRKNNFNKQEILDCLISNCNKYSTPFCINNRYIEPNKKSEELKKIFCDFIF